MTFRSPIAALTLAVCASFSATFSAVTRAHTDEMLSAMQAPHGGQLRVAGPYHFELVSSAHKLQVYVTDHAGTAQDMRGAKGQVFVLSAGKKTKLELAFQEANLLQASADLAPEESTQLVVQISDAKGLTQQAKFTPFAKQNEHHQEH